MTVEKGETMSEVANNQEIKQPTVKERLAEHTSGIEKGIQDFS